jgi:plasmid stability protein
MFCWVQLTGRIVVSPVRLRGFEPDGTLAGERMNSDSGGPTCGASPSQTALQRPLCTDSGAAPTLAALVRDAGPAIHADGFSQARWLLHAGFAVAAPATARAELERRLRDALRVRAGARHDLDEHSFRELLTAALWAGIVDPSTGSTIDTLERRLNDFARGRRTDLQALAACFDELNVACAALLERDEPEAE